MVFETPVDLDKLQSMQVQDLEKFAFEQQDFEKCYCPQLSDNSFEYKANHIQFKLLMTQKRKEFIQPIREVHQYCQNSKLFFVFLHGRYSPHSIIRCLPVQMLKLIYSFLVPTKSLC